MEINFFMLPFELAFGFLGPIISKIIGFSISMYFYIYIFCLRQKTRDNCFVCMPISNFDYYELCDGVSYGYCI